MDIVFQSGSAAAADVLDRLPDPPSYSAVRALLRTLVEKGHLTHRQEGMKYVYLPTVAPAEAKQSALRHLLQTFFHNSPTQVVAALLDASAAGLTQEKLDRMTALIEQARQQGR